MGGPAVIRDVSCCSSTKQLRVIEAQTESSWRCTRAAARPAEARILERPDRGAFNAKNNRLLCITLRAGFRD